MLDLESLTRLSLFCVPVKIRRRPYQLSVNDYTLTL